MVLSTTKVLGSAGGLIVLAVVLVFGLKECEGRREGRDDELAEQLRKQAAEQRDSALALMARVGTTLDRFVAKQAEDSAFDAETRRQITTLTRAYDRISRNQSGGGTFDPDPTEPGTRPEEIGPRTMGFIDQQAAMIVRLQGTVTRDSVDKLALFAAADTARRAFATLNSAYQKKSEEAEIYRRQRYGWKDRVTGSVCYTPLRTDAAVDGGACYTLVRPLRAIDSVSDLVRRVF